MFRNYFIVNSLPTLSLSQKPEITFLDLIRLYKMNLSKSEFQKTRDIRLFIDLQNVLKVLKKEPLDLRGNLTEKELDEAIVHQINLPKYLIDYLDREENPIEKYYEVMSIYFQEELERQTGFFQKYVKFEQELRLTLATIRCKKRKKDLSEELYLEDQGDFFVHELFSQKDQETIEFEEPFQSLAIKLKQVDGNPFLQKQVVVQFRFDQIQEMVEGDIFSIDYLLAYMIQLILVEDWNFLNKEQGSAILNKIVKESL